MSSRRSRRAERGGTCAIVVLQAALAGSTSPGRAATVETDVSVTGQAYELRTADPGNPVAGLVDRRRLTTYLGLYISGLGEKDSDGLPALRNQVSVNLQLRFDADLGDYLCSIGRTTLGAALGCLDQGQGGVSTSPELGNYKPELLVAYVEGQRMGGYIDFRLGRQLQWELFDLRALDGLWLQARTPLYFAAEVFGGLSVSGALPIDSPLYVLDGTSRNPSLTPGPQPAQQSDALQPTVGFAVRSSELRDLQMRLSYRRTFSLTQDAAAAGCELLPSGGGPKPCAPELGTIEERLAYTVSGRLLSGRLQAWGGLRYDFVSGGFDDGHVGLRGVLGPLHALQAEYRYSAPTWDGDSIFNVFSAMPYHELKLGYDGKLRKASGELLRLGDLALYARAFARLFATATAHGAPQGAGDSTLSPAFGGSIGARLSRRIGTLRLDAYGDGGYGGVRAGAELSGRLLLLRNTFGLEGRAMYLYWEDDQRESNRSHSGALQAGVRYAIVRGILLHVLAEDNINRFYSTQLRFLATLDLSYYLGAFGVGNPPAGLAATGLGGFPPPGALPGVLQ
jgi:hypothetical protein